MHSEPILAKPRMTDSVSQLEIITRSVPSKDRTRMLQSYYFLAEELTKGALLKIAELQNDLQPLHVCVPSTTNDEPIPGVDKAEMPNSEMQRWPESVLCPQSYDICTERNTYSDPASCSASYPVTSLPEIPLTRRIIITYNKLQAKLCADHINLMAYDFRNTACPPYGEEAAFRKRSEGELESALSDNNSPLLFYPLTTLQSSEEAFRSFGKLAETVRRLPLSNCFSAKASIAKPPHGLQAFEDNKEPGYPRVILESTHQILETLSAEASSEVASIGEIRSKLLNFHFFFLHRYWHYCRSHKIRECRTAAVAGSDFSLESCSTNPPSADEINLTSVPTGASCLDDSSSADFYGNSPRGEDFDVRSDNLQKNKAEAAVDTAADTASESIAFSIWATNLCDSYSEKRAEKIPLLDMAVKLCYPIAPEVLKATLLFVQSSVTRIMREAFFATKNLEANAVLDCQMCGKHSDHVQCSASTKHSQESLLGTPDQFSILQEQDASQGIYSKTPCCNFEEVAPLQSIYHFHPFPCHDVLHTNAVSMKTSANGYSLGTQGLKVEDDESELPKMPVSVGAVFKPSKALYAVHKVQQIEVWPRAPDPQQTKQTVHHQFKPHEAVVLYVDMSTGRLCGGQLGCLFPEIAAAIIQLLNLRFYREPERCKKSSSPISVENGPTGITTSECTATFVEQGGLTLSPELLSMLQQSDLFKQLCIRDTFLLKGTEESNFTKSAFQQQMKRQHLDAVSHGNNVQDSKVILHSASAPEFFPVTGNESGNLFLPTERTAGESLIRFRHSFHGGTRSLRQLRKVRSSENFLVMTQSAEDLATGNNATDHSGLRLQNTVSNVEVGRSSEAAVASSEGSLSSATFEEFCGRINWVIPKSYDGTPLPAFRFIESSEECKDVAPKCFSCWLGRRYLFPSANSTCLPRSRLRRRKKISMARYVPEENHRSSRTDALGLSDKVAPLTQLQQSQQKPAIEVKRIVQNESAWGNPEPKPPILELKNAVKRSDIRVSNIQVATTEYSIEHDFHAELSRLGTKRRTALCNLRRWRTASATSQKERLIEKLMDMESGLWQRLIEVLWLFGASELKMPRPALWHDDFSGSELASCRPTLCQRQLQTNIGDLLVKLAKEQQEIWDSLTTLCSQREVYKDKPEVVKMAAETWSSRGASTRCSARELRPRCSVDSSKNKLQCVGETDSSRQVDGGSRLDSPRFSTHHPSDISNVDKWCSSASLPPLHDEIDLGQQAKNPLRSARCACFNVVFYRSRLSKTSASEEPGAPFEQRTNRRSLRHFCRRFTTRFRQRGTPGISIENGTQKSLIVEIQNACEPLTHDSRCLDRPFLSAGSSCRDVRFGCSAFSTRDFEEAQSLTACTVPDERESVENYEDVLDITLDASSAASPLPAASWTKSPVPCISRMSRKGFFGTLK